MSLTEKAKVHTWLRKDWEKVVETVETKMQGLTVVISDNN